MSGSLSVGVSDLKKSLEPPSLHRVQGDSPPFQRIDELPLVRDVAPKLKGARRREKGDVLKAIPRPGVDVGGPPFPGFEQGPDGVPGLQITSGKAEGEFLLRPRN